jgi:hypothetical protein
VHILSKRLSVISFIYILAIFKYTGLDVYIIVALNIKPPLLFTYKEEIFFIYSGRLTRKEE